eukprot:TRINITY_DN1638_c0_g1_i1.p1 TRINITY_DN1638_c0_g1~~TRINITY_DN1638_c0_g1_i1.p1  ORF type:complete len:167 (+),score=33.86 TRINITY_DN1638_c0_g1_i1:94-594(+)
MFGGGGFGQFDSQGGHAVDEHGRAIQAMNGGTFRAETSPYTATIHADEASDLYDGLQESNYGFGGVQHINQLYDFRGGSVPEMVKIEGTPQFVQQQDGGQALVLSSTSANQIKLVMMEKYFESQLAVTIEDGRASLTYLTKYPRCRVDPKSQPLLTDRQRESNHTL